MYGLYERLLDFLIRALGRQFVIANLATWRSSLGLYPPRIFMRITMRNTAACGRCGGADGRCLLNAFFLNQMAQALETAAPCRAKAADRHAQQFRKILVTQRVIHH